jgi:Zn finger protein HypA/HybF involved in hydrogenase expression
MNPFISTMTGLSALFTAALITGCASTGPRVAEEQKFIQLHHVANTGEEVNLKKGDAVAMVCTKCKTVLYANLHKPYSRFVTPFEHRHYCPGCKSTITTTGSGFSAKEEVRHTCEACGSDSLFCCATTRSASSTSGMDKK